MGIVWTAIKSHKTTRTVEILLITIVLLVIFSVSGMPLILLSKFSPAWDRVEAEQDVSEQSAFEGSSAAT